MKEVNYFTDASIVNNSCCSGYLYIEKGGNYSKANVVNTECDIHKAELIAIKRALIDIHKNYNPNTKYTIYTDSDTACNFIKNDSNKYTEVNEIRGIIPLINNNLKITVVKSHATKEQQMKYFKDKYNKNISNKQAIAINEGNSKIDKLVRTGNSYENFTMYNSTPFRINL